MKIIDYEKKEMMPLTYKQISIMKSKKFVTYVKMDLALTMELHSAELRSTKNIIK